MGYFESFYVLRENKKGDRFYLYKTLDTERVESWEVVDDEHTRVFMKSGDVFVIKEDIKTFGEIVIDDEDAYGKILVFGKN